MNVLQIVDDRKTRNSLREKCMESVKRFVTENDTYTVKGVSYNTDINAMIDEMDKIRFSYAKGYDDLLYVDADCFLVSLPSEEQLKKEKIIIGQTETTNGPVFDPFLFYVNGKKDFFQANYEKLLRREYTAFQDNVIAYAQFSYYHLSLMNIEFSVNNQLRAYIERIESCEKEISSYRSGIQNLINTAQLFDDLKRKDKNG